MRMLLVLGAFVLAGCGSAPEPKAAPVQEAVAPVAPLRDNRLLLPGENQKSAKVVQGHLMDNHVLPGGSLGEYESDGRSYEMFVVETASAQDAAILLLDMKVTLKEPAYIAYMGGYFGVFNGKDFYVFAKGKYLAGVVGLSEDLADPIARVLAAKVR
jgi:hypothetical protein